jgi:hypothetical protein
VAATAWSSAADAASMFWRRAASRACSPAIAERAVATMGAMDPALVWERRVPECLGGGIEIVEFLELGRIRTALRPMRVPSVNAGSCCASAGPFAAAARRINEQDAVSAARVMCRVM